MTSEWTVYVNHKCSKCRAALELLESKGVGFHLVEYLKTPLSEAALKSLLAKLKVPARDLVRTKDPSFASLRLDLNDDGAVVAALAKYPELLERPIVVRGERAVLGRPTENILQLL